MPAARRHGSIVSSVVQWPNLSAPVGAWSTAMHDLTTTDLDTDPSDDSASDRDQCDQCDQCDQRYQTRMAWIASSWAAMAVLATAIAIWDSWHLSP